MLSLLLSKWYHFAHKYLVSCGQRREAEAYCSVKACVLCDGTGHWYCVMAAGQDELGGWVRWVSRQEGDHWHSSHGTLEAHYWGAEYRARHKVEEIMRTADPCLPTNNMLILDLHEYKQIVKHYTSSIYLVLYVALLNVDKCTFHQPHTHYQLNSKIKHIQDMGPYLFILKSGSYF